MKIENLDKLPLYLTKGHLISERRDFYGLLKKYYNGELFDWIDKCYPDRFVPHDFNIWYGRNRFDSIEEQRVHDILENKFGRSLFYNSGDASNRIKVGIYQPDWIALCEKPIIIEYFGMYVDNNNSKRVVDYVDKTHRKIEFYDGLKYYDKLFIYPDDLRDDCEGLRNKIKEY